MKWFIIERSRPGMDTYYILAGQRTKEQAEELPKVKFGKHALLSFDNGCDYWTAAESFRRAGKKVVS